MTDELLSLLNYELGQILDWEELCPGVYYLGVQPDPDSVYPCSEYYLVLPDAPISREARALGRALDGIPGLLYAIDPPEEGGWTAILYELCKNQSRHGSQPLEGWSLSDAAMEGMELCPTYFGSFPVPPYTPWGWTLRYRALDNGVYWLETSQCKTALAVCHRIWSTEFSDGVAQAGKKLAHNKADDVELDYRALTANDALRDWTALRRFCWSHPEAQANLRSEDESNFYLVGEVCNFWIRLIAQPKECSLYLHMFTKDEETK